jgi:hypothetical protein
MAAKILNYWLIRTKKFIQIYVETFVYRQQDSKARKPAVKKHVEPEGIKMMGIFPANPEMDCDSLEMDGDVPEMDGGALEMDCHNPEISDIP